MSNFLNEKQKKSLLTGIYICDKCGAEMKLEEGMEDVYICPECGYDVDFDHYGFKSEDEYNAVYPTLEEVLEREKEIGNLK